MPSDIRITGAQLAHEHELAAREFADDLGRGVESVAVVEAPLQPPYRTSSGQFRGQRGRERAPGALRRSIHKRDVERAETPQGVAIYCDVVAGAVGSEAEEYAAAQHEHTEWKHTTGKAKYLSDPARATMPFSMALLAQRVHDRLERLRARAR